MNISIKNLATCLLTAVCALVFFDLRAQPKVTELLKKYNTTLFYINEFYFDTVNFEQIVDRSIVSALQALDPHSYYIPKEEYKQMSEPLEGNFEGIGIEFNILEDTLIVVTPLVGGPSEKVGLQSKDRIIKVDGKNITNISLTIEKVHSLLRGPKGSKVALTIKRGTATIEFEIIRDKIPINSLEAAYEPEKGVAYIKLSRFAKTSMNEILDAFAKFDNPQSLILDLRHNGGGLMDAAIHLVDQFLSKGKLIVYTEGLHSPVRRATSTDNGVFLNGNLAVLIDESSASASEIVAGAVQDWDRGVIIGRRSFGKGLVQNEFRMDDGSAIRLTVARYHTPSGRAIQSPYEKGKKEEYYTSFVSRMSSEMFVPDSIKFPDSLKYQTLVKKRTVYGGGGIMPDIYVPMDTSNYSQYTGELARKGSLSRFLSSYIDRHGNEIKSQYPTFETFRQSYTVTEAIFAQMVDYAEKDGVKKDENGIRISGNYLKHYMKAVIARYLFDNNSYYIILNENDREFAKALEMVR
ncbi:MAG: PDZ domain-containing protein [Prevotellaceae bacterium]|jgi:carboxyl-terminal processing protease|nr:PDZ domain-containing protein [Prevotellaceae bacterium]